MPKNLNIFCEYVTIKAWVSACDELPREPKQGNHVVHTVCKYLGCIHLGDVRGHTSSAHKFESLSTNTIGVPSWCLRTSANESRSPSFHAPHVPKSGSHNGCSSPVGLMLVCLLRWQASHVSKAFYSRKEITSRYKGFITSNIRNTLVFYYLDNQRVWQDARRLRSLRLGISSGSWFTRHFFAYTVC